MIILENAIYGAVEQYCVVFSGISNIKSTLIDMNGVNKI